ncbi:Crp/Fnr family transcriptional regulator [bacterium]|nr:Crp/Fnr family transcriptional regulator [bacterium]
MISPELLRKYAFFGFLSDEDFDKIAMVAEEGTWQAGETLFTLGDKADHVYFLENGEVNLHYKVVDELVSNKSKEFYVGDINPGEPFGLSALIKPHAYTATALVGRESKGIIVDAEKLLALANAQPELGYGLMQQVAKSTFERLGQVRVELVAARP